MARAWTSVRVSKWEARRPDAVASQSGRSENLVAGVALGSYLGKVLLAGQMKIAKKTVQRKLRQPTYKFLNGFL
jgi:hypothetical protein